ncbi:MAG: hypothetical protein JJ979_03595 [Roseibium sp.]|nr:hypothetical protein [Roseibium sp.]
MSDETQESEDTKPAKRRMVVKNPIHAGELQHDLQINEVDLTNAMMKQSSLFAHYGVLHAKAMRQVEDFKLAEQVVSARVGRQVRDKAVSDKEKLTVDQVKAAVDDNKTVRHVRRCLNEAKQIEQQAKTAVESFRHRRDMLIQIGLRAREEMKGEVRIAAKKEHENARKSAEERMLSRQRDRAEADTEAEGV